MRSHLTTYSHTRAEMARVVRDMPEFRHLPSRRLDIELDNPLSRSMPIHMCEETEPGKFVCAEVVHFCVAGFLFRLAQNFNISCTVCGELSWNMMRDDYPPGREWDIKFRVEPRYFGATQKRTHEWWFAFRSKTWRENVYARRTMLPSENPNNFFCPLCKNCGRSFMRTLNCSGVKTARGGISAVANEWLTKQLVKNAA